MRVFIYLSFFLNVSDCAAQTVLHGTSVAYAIIDKREIQIAADSKLTSTERSILGCKLFHENGFVWATAGIYFIDTVFRINQVIESAIAKKENFEQVQASIDSSLISQVKHKWVRFKDALIQLKRPERTSPLFGVLLCKIVGDSAVFEETTYFLHGDSALPDARYTKKFSKDLDNKYKFHIGFLGSRDSAEIVTRKFKGKNGQLAMDGEEFLINECDPSLPLRPLWGKLSYSICRNKKEPRFSRVPNLCR